ncbi:hypothetical protein [Arthrobacter sp. 31Y]|uniref:hypothetical protein n=1 Tax=Arthrobacter sp. 31Y TaxID=1115632 RepID=UPI0006876AF6|nr:hypothetical protein [Arthrobacter sp. 31Y]
MSESGLFPASLFESGHTVVDGRENPVHSSRSAVTIRFTKLPISISEVESARTSTWIRFAVSSANMLDQLLKVQPGGGDALDAKAPVLQGLDGSAAHVGVPFAVLDGRDDFPLLRVEPGPLQQELVGDVGARLQWPCRSEPAVTSPFIATLPASRCSDLFFGKLFGLLGFK